MPPPLAKPRVPLLLIAMLLSIGLADYASGIRISLAAFYLVPILLAVAWSDWEIALGIGFAATAESAWVRPHLDR